MYLNQETSKYKYNHTAWFYQQLASIYSAGQIKASKVSQIKNIQAGEKVLYAGVGTGEEVIDAVEKKAFVTCIDLSASMLGRTKNKVYKKSTADAEFICDDIMRHDRIEYYDVICANYFLNVFNPELMEDVFKHLKKCLKPGGKIMIADFSIPSGNFISRSLHTLYYRIANIFYWLLAGNDLHPIYDYKALLTKQGLECKEQNKFPLLKIGPQYFQSITGIKKIIPE